MGNDILGSIWPEWRVVRVIGKGSYGTVYEVEKDSPSGSRRAALKVISIPAGDRVRELIDGFVGELMVEESLRSTENIVYIEDYRVVERPDGTGWDIYILMELLTSLSDKMARGSFDEKAAVNLGIDICSALEHYEKRGTVHGDIKPENIFISSSGRYKLADFSIDKLTGEVKEGLTMQDAFSFNAPEVQMDGKYGPTADTYSLGMLLYVLTNNNMMPFSDGSSDANALIGAAARRFNGEVLPPPANASADLAQVIRIACDPDPEERFGSAAAMKNALKEIKTEPVHDSAPSSRVKLVTPPPADAPAPHAPRKAVQEPARRTNPAKIIVPIVIAVAATALIVLGIIFIPKLFKGKSGPRPAETTAAAEAETKAVNETSPALQQTPATESTTGAAAETKEQETTRQYSKGDIITFGNYEQDNNAANGKEQIEWIVLDVQADRLLLISRYGLDGQQYDTSGNKNVSWQNCTLRGWLNGAFYSEAFSSEEQDKIVEALVRADRNSQYPDRDAGADTVDKVFLLSTSEAERYFASDAARKLEITEYAKTRGVTYCDNKDNQGYGYWWWLRSPGRDEDYAALVFPEGKVDHVGYHYNDTENAVRPAIWIKP